jgi:hypothetical protein
MKKICLTITIVVFLLFLLNGVQAQTQQTKLDPVECIHQIKGSWKVELAKDTTVYADFTPFGTGLDATMKFVSKGKTFMERRINWAYDKTLNRFIGLDQTKGGDVVSLAAAQWISLKKYILVDYKDISNPEEASARTEGILKSHELLEITYYVNNKPINTLNYIRVK